MFDQGQIVEDGSHDELIKAGGKYAQMWTMQAGGFLPEKEPPSEEMQLNKVDIAYLDEEKAEIDDGDDD